MPNLSAEPTRREPAHGGFFHRFCCCPWGADLLWAGLAATLLLGVLVVAGNQLLAVSDDLGFMDFLAGGKLAPPGAPAVTVESCDGLQDSGHRSRLVQACWTPAQVRAVPWLLALDTGWGLLYAGVLALLGMRLLSELIADRQGRRCGSAGGDGSPDSPARAWAWMLLLALPPAALLAVDWVENWQAWRLAAAGLPNHDSAYTLLNAAAVLKVRLAAAAVGLVVLLLALWLFGVLFGIGAGHDQRRDQRALLRLAVERIIWRSRYVLAMLALFGFMALGMDQSRDVLVGMAQGLVPAEQPGPTAIDGRQVLWVLVAIVMTIVAVWMLAYAAWLWSRIPARMAPPEAPLRADAAPPARAAAAGDSPARSADGRDQFAKWWARWLGLVPLLMLIALAGLASGDAMRVAAGGLAAGLADTARAQATGAVLWVFALATAVLGIAIQVSFARDRGRETIGSAAQSPASNGPCGPARKQALYYNAVSVDAAADELATAEGRYRFLFYLRRAPLTLPIVALVAFEALRAVDLFLAGRVPVTVAVIALALTLWTCVLGLLAQASRRQSMPWVLGLLVLVGLLSLWGVTDNHRVLTTPYAVTGPPVLWGMWLAQLVLAAMLALALYWSWLRLTVLLRREEPRWLAWLVDKLSWTTKPLARIGLVAPEARGSRQHMAVDVVFFVVLALLTLPVLRLSDLLLAPEGPMQQALAPPTTPNTSADPGPRPALNAAVGDWIRARLAAAPGGPAEPVPVYFVSAEGGGIRAAYWTALVLARQAQASPSFPAHTFSISGVSGGAIGAAVWTLCRGQAPAGHAAPAGDCIHRLSDANLLTPLLSAWLFEDVLGALLPTTLDTSPLRCTTPGCAVLSRGLLFERALEASLPGLSRPLMVTNKAPPYLFLNSTRVEDGSRAIASPVIIDAGAFPSSVDQLDVLGTRLALSTAAHNAARFTYVNAIGAVGTQEATATAAATATAVESRPSQSGSDAQPLTFVDRYHLADGGYFDNSGGHTTADIMRAFTRCLFAPTEPTPCGLAGPELRAARQRLLPQAIKIRNGIEPVATSGAAPARNGGSGMPACAPLPTPEPGSLDLYPDVLGPAVTAFNVIGTGANGRVAEADVCRVVQSWWLLRAQAGGAPVTGEPALVRRCDLVDENVLYPLGWYLSPTAAAGMRAEAMNDGRMAACLAGFGAAEPKSP